MKIRVTQKHIDKGKRREASSCPVALAVKDVGFEYVWVGPKYINSSCKLYLLPKAAQFFVQDFDDEKPVQPFEFEVSEAL